MQDIERVYKKYFGTVHKFLFCLTHDKDISEDLTQETFYKVAKNLHSFKGEAKISVWLCQIAKNIWIDEMRKNKLKAINNMNEDIPSEIDIEEDYNYKEEILRIYKKIEKMDNNTKEVMYLRLQEELSFKQIGDILGKSENWARIVFYRGKQKIKEDEYYEK